MTSDRHGRPPAHARRLMHALLTLVLAALLGGCSLLSDWMAVEQALAKAGVRTDSLRYDTAGGHSVLTIVYHPVALGLDDQRDELDGVARAVWASAPVRFDELRVVPGSAGRRLEPRSYPRAALQASYGPRQPALDRRQPGRSMARDLLATGLVVVVLLVIAVLAVVGAAARGRRPPWHEVRV